MKKQTILAAAFGCVVAIVVVLGAVRARRRAMAPPPTILEATKVIRIVEHDRSGLVARQVTARDPARVRALLDAVGVTALSDASCAEDYSGSEIDLVLSGSDAYARRTLHLYRLNEPPGEVILSSTSGCARGPIARIDALRDTLSTLEWK